MSQMSRLLEPTYVAQRPQVKRLLTQVSGPVSKSCHVNVAVPYDKYVNPQMKACGLEAQLKA